MKRPTDRTILCGLALLCVAVICFCGLIMRNGWFGYHEFVASSPSMVYMESPSDLYKTTSININTATVDQLQTLPGIGEATAQNIVTYRNEHGSFSTVEALLDVKGIGDATLEKIKPYVTCQ
jgi:comEA protein